MPFYEEMAEVVVELLADGDDSFGEDVLITRPAGGYDPNTRTVGTGTPQQQTVRGTADTSLSDVSMPGSLASRFAAVLLAAPAATNGFEPGQNDRVSIGGKAYIVEETAHVIKAGIPILWQCGMKSA